MVEGEGEEERDFLLLLVVGGGGGRLSCQRFITAE